MEQNYDKSNENVIEWLTGEHYCVATYTSRKHINRIKKLYEERKDEFKYFVENKDGSVCAKFPVKWVKNNAGSLPGTKNERIMTDEQKAAFVERMKNNRSKQ